MKNINILLIYFLLHAVVLHASPGRVIIIRHGEKPVSGNELSNTGCERAFLLPNFFSQWGDITAIYAQQPSSLGSSIRSIETVTPTSNFENIKINNSFQKDEHLKLVTNIMSDHGLDGKTVVISWEHSVISKIAEDFGVKLTSSLANWSSSIFDQAWILTFNSSGSLLNLEIVAEHVLPSDIDNSSSGVSNWGSEEPQANNGIKIPQAVLDKCKNGNDLLNQQMDAAVSIPVPR